MKRLFTFISLALITLLFFTTSIKGKAHDLDYIEDYIVYVNPNKADGSLHMKYEIRWKVLDSSTDGPLEWVKIGIPNRYVENITPITKDVIKKIKYYSDSGSFIRIDFNRKYRRDDVVYFSFEFDISRMYFIDGDNVLYNFRTGFFEEIRIGHHALYWAKDGIDSDFVCDRMEGDYFVIEKNNLFYKDRIDVNAKYDISYFDSIDKTKTYSSQYMTIGDYLRIVFVIAIILLIITFVIYFSRKQRDPYMYNRGFIGGYHYHYFYHSHHYYSNGYDRSGHKINPPSSTGTSGSSFSSGGGHCACACACACAGGGRAGCTKKDFYNTTFEPEDIV